MFLRLGLLVLDFWVGLSLGAVGGGLLGVLVGAILFEIAMLPRTGKFPALEACIVPAEVGAVAGSICGVWIAFGFKRRGNPATPN